MRFPQSRHRRAGIFPRSENRLLGGAGQTKEPPYLAPDIVNQRTGNAVIDDLKETPIPARRCDFLNRVIGAAIAQSADIDHRDRRAKLRRRCNRMIVQVCVVLTIQNEVFRGRRTTG